MLTHHHTLNQLRLVLVAQFLEARKSGDFGSDGTASGDLLSTATSESSTVTVAECSSLPVADTRF